MRNLVEIYNTNDLRWLLDVDVLPEDYDTEYLIPVLDEIIFEDEELSGNNFYTNFLRKSDFAAKDAIKLTGLRWGYEIVLCNPLKIDEVKEVLKSEVKINIDSLDNIDREMNLITQRLQVKAMKESGKEKEKQSFGKMCAYIKSQLPNADPRNATVAEFRGYQDIINQMKESNG